MTNPGRRPAAPAHRRNLVLVWAAAALVLAAAVVLGAIRTVPSPESEFLTRSPTGTEQRQSAANHNRSDGPAAPRRRPLRRDPADHR